MHLSHGSLQKTHYTAEVWAETLSECCGVKVDSQEVGWEDKKHLSVHLARAQILQNGNQGGRCPQDKSLRVHTWQPEGSASPGVRVAVPQATEHLSEQEAAPLGTPQRDKGPEFSVQKLKRRLQNSWGQEELPFPSYRSRM